MTRTDKRDAVLLIIEAFITLTIMQTFMFTTYAVLASWGAYFPLIIALRALFFTASGTLAILGFTNGIKGARIYRLSLAILLAAAAIFESVLFLL